MYAWTITYNNLQSTASTRIAVASRLIIIIIIILTKNQSIPRKKEIMSSKSKESTNLRKRQQKNLSAAEAEIPEDARKAKEKLEKETGKNYQYKREMPSIQHMLVHGAPESQGRPKTWTETIGYPLVLAILFFVSFLIFVHAPHAKSRQYGKKFTIPKMPPAEQQQESIIQLQNEKESSDPPVEED